MALKTPFSDPSLPLTEAAAKEIDNISAIGALYAVGQRTHALEQATSTLEDSLDEVEGFTRYAVGWSSISLAVNPTAADTLTIGDDTYEFLDAGDVVADDEHIGVLIGGNAGATQTNLLAAINGTAFTPNGILKSDGKQARLRGTTFVRAGVNANILRVWAADAVGGDAAFQLGVSFDAALTSTETWRFSTDSGSLTNTIRARSVVRISRTLTAGDISAGSLTFLVSPGPAGNNIHWRISAVTTAGVLKTGFVDPVTYTAIGSDGRVGAVTLTLPGGGGNLAATDRVFLEGWYA